METSNNSNITNSDLRKFGFIMGGMFALLFGLIFPWIAEKNSHNWPVWPFIVMAVFWGIALFMPQVLRPVNTIWIKIGNVLGWVNSRIILGIMFFLIILPIGLILKLFGKDSMNRKFDKKLETYRRVTNPRSKENLEKPF